MRVVTLEVWMAERVGFVPRATSVSESLEA
jgi:hypothetical protein